MTKTMFDDNFVVTDRGGVIENTHEVHAAIVDKAGRLLYYVGNPHRVTLLRSAAKPAQALAVVETGGFDSHGWDDADLALMCASHNSESRHVERAQAMLEEVGATESDLRCGGHPAASHEVNQGWIRDGFKPTAVCNNCSGKHVGMLAGAKAIGADFKNYHSPDHPIQQWVKKVVGEVAGLEPDEIKWGVDGCNMPAPAYPLISMGKTYALFAEAADLAAKNEMKGERQGYMARIFKAMAGYPEMVAGEGRFCTALMQAFQGQLIGKLGADGCYGIGIRESEDTRRLGANGPLGIAVKIGDGNLDILYSAVTEILEQLRIGTQETRDKLRSFHKLKFTNTMGVVTGCVEFQFKLRNG